MSGAAIYNIITNPTISFDPRDVAGFPDAQINSYCNSTWISGGWAIGGESSVSYSTGPDIAFVNGSGNTPESFNSWINLENFINTDSSLMYDILTDRIYLSTLFRLYTFDNATKTLIYATVPSSINGITPDNAGDSIEYRQYSLYLYNIKYHPLGTSVISGSSPDNSSIKSTVVYIFNPSVLTLMHYQYLGTWYYPDPLTSLKQTLDFDGVTYTPSGGSSRTLTSSSRVRPVAVMPNDDIILLEDKYVMITDGFSTNIKAAYGPMSTTGAPIRYDTGYRDLDTEDLYLGNYGGPYCYFDYVGTAKYYDPYGNCADESCSTFDSNDPYDVDDYTADPYDDCGDTCATFDSNNPYGV